MTGYRSERDMVRGGGQAWRTPEVGSRYASPRPRSRWVVLDQQHEALLVRWRRDASGAWQALVCHVADDGEVWSWVAAERLAPHRCA